MGSSARLGRQWERHRLVGRRGLRIALGIIWLFDAALQAEGPKFAGDYPLGDLAQSVMGAPGWVNRSIFAGIQPFVAHWPWWNLASALLQAAIGIALVTGRFTRVALAVSFAWALTIWWLGEGFGMLPSGFALMEAGAPGPALLYAILGALAWPRAGRPDVDRRSWAASWSVLWLGAGLLHAPVVYPSGQVLQANLAELAGGSPRYLADTSTWLAGIAAHHAVALSVALAVLEVAVGLGCLVDRARLRTWLGLGIALTVFFWIVVQQMGGILTSGATDPSLGPLMVLLALAAWPGRASLLAASPGAHRVATGSEILGSCCRSVSWSIVGSSGGPDRRAPTERTVPWRSI